MDRKNNDDEQTPRLRGEQNTKRHENVINHEMEKYARMTYAIRVNDLRTTTLQIWGTELYRTK